MIAPYYYIDAKRRLREASITIDMMGGPDECQPMIVAQRDMLQLEMDYYLSQTKKFTFRALVFGAVVVLYYLFRSYM